MIKSLLKNAIPIIAMIPLLGACSPFQPKTKVIEYDEEVKLHDGSMIWVHIKRHYERSSGREISNWFQGYEKGWGAKEVEISWDTGFPNVGRKSVFFDDVAYVSRLDDKWYIFGFMPKNSDSKRYSSENCKTVGVKIGKFGCAVIVDSNGFIKPADTDKNLEWKGWNVLYPIGIRNWGSVPEPLDGKKLTWNEKLGLEETQPQRLRRINRSN